MLYDRIRSGGFFIGSLGNSLSRYIRGTKVLTRLRSEEAVEPFILLKKLRVINPDLIIRKPAIPMQFCITRCPDNFDAVLNLEF